MGRSLAFFACLILLCACVRSPDEPQTLRFWVMGREGEVVGIRHDVVGRLDVVSYPLETRHHKIRQLPRPVDHEFGPAHEGPAGIQVEHEPGAVPYFGAVAPDIGIDNVVLDLTPEPTTMTLGLIGMAVAAVVRRRRRK